MNISFSGKWFIYAALNFAFCLLLVVGAAVGGGSLTQLPYVAVLFAICLSPLPFIDRLNGAFAMLGVTMAVYFVEFGALDAASMLKPPANASDAQGMLGRTELVLWLGALMQVVGFHAAARVTRSRERTVSALDWPKSLLVPIGMLFWAAAMAATLYHDFVVQPENTSVSVASGLSKLGIWK